MPQIRLPTGNFCAVSSEPVATTVPEKSRPAGTPCGKPALMSLASDGFTATQAVLSKTWSGRSFGILSDTAERVSGPVRIRTCRVEGFIALRKTACGLGGGILWSEREDVQLGLYLS